MPRGWPGGGPAGQVRARPTAGLLGRGSALHSFPHAWPPKPQLMGVRKREAALPTLHPSGTERTDIVAPRPMATQHGKTAGASPLTGPETKNLTPDLLYVLRPLSRRAGGTARPGPGRGRRACSGSPALQAHSSSSQGVA